MVNQDALVRPLRLQSLISGLIAAHLFIVGAWLMPDSWMVRNKVADVIRPYVLFTGLWQQWEMFCPTPSHANGYVSAEVTMSDGTHRTWIPPLMHQLGLLERYQKERYRKWMDNLRDEDSRLGWPDAARFIARAQARAGFVPVEVKFTRHWALIPPPEQGLGRPLPAIDQHDTYFTYVVKPEDLK